MVAYFYAPKRHLGQARGIKGHEDFIEALALVRREIPGVVGVCIGGAWEGARAYERRVRDLAARRVGEGLRFLGTRDDVLDLYPDLDVAVHPSLSENLGGAVESLLMGVPTVATDVGGFPDLVVPGRTGRLVPPRSPRALATAILATLEGPEEARRMAERGRRTATDLFDPAAKAAEIRRIYEDVLSHRP
jgi:glycosyltransferase involved in cell wall biosynthesis